MRPAAKNTYDGRSRRGGQRGPSGTWAPKLATLSSSKVAGISGVRTGPGGTLLTRMPRSWNAWASE